MGEQAERLQDLEDERREAVSLHRLKRSHDDQKCALCRQESYLEMRADDEYDLEK